LTNHPKMNSSRLFLVRHGLTEMIARRRLHGRLDSPLTKAGIADARAAAQSFKGKSIDHLLTSPMGRAMQTAAIIGEAIGMKPVAVDGLKERHYGWLEGRSLDLVDPLVRKSWLTRQFIQLANRFSGESLDHFCRRIVGTTDEILSRHAGQSIILVVHWGILSIITEHLIKGSVENWKSAGPWAACGITELNANSHGWQAVRVNDISHLDHPEIKRI
jgi:probable phosphoglycerate mutase